jgi:hypothetical protein
VDRVFLDSSIEAVGQDFAIVLLEPNERSQLSRRLPF